MTRTALSSPLPVDAVSQPVNGVSQLQCPDCRQYLHLSDARADWICKRCGFALFLTDGIFRALMPHRESHFRQFVRDYELVREKEGRGSSTSEYYLQLPYKDVTGHNTWQWAIRGRTFRHMEQHILPAIERAFPAGCDLLDLGAGNCWLSYRLALRGHRPIAVDLLDNNTDGLGAGRHYLSRLPQQFLRFQAEMDRMPFSPQQFDVAIFNASIHYSVDYEQTLRETLRCLRRPAHVIIADSPFYRRSQSGELMKQEKHAAFQRQFGLRSDSIPSREYLTLGILDDLGTKLGIEWQVLKPWYGLGWALRPVKAWLKQRREPSQFFLVWGQVRG